MARMSGSAALSEPFPQARVRPAAQHCTGGRYRASDRRRTDARVSMRVPRLLHGTDPRAETSRDVSAGDVASGVDLVHVSVDAQGDVTVLAPVHRQVSAH